MADQRHLKKAPITEAIIDFRVQLPGDFDVSVFKKLHGSLQRDYPKIEERKQSDYAFSFRPGQAAKSVAFKEDIQGYFFRSDDKKKIAQFRRDGFTFNRLKPYTSWKDVFEEASRLWNIYLETVPQQEITRIATRYVNKLHLPGPHVAFSEYFSKPPDVPDGLPELMPEYFSRMVLRDEKQNLQAIIIQKIEPWREDKLPVIFDIDVFEASPDGLPADDILERFDKLRKMKNDIFFRSLTDKTIQLYV